jgi:hypothetical protein
MPLGIIVMFYGIIGVISFIAYGIANEGQGTWNPHEAIATLIAWPVVVILYTVYGLSSIWYRQVKKLGERR